MEVIKNKTVLSINIPKNENFPANPNKLIEPKFGKAPINPKINSNL